MDVYKKIRAMRYLNRWLQEDMAGKMDMSISGYIKIEQDETKLYIDKLKIITQIFNIDVKQLMDTDKNAVIFFINENGDHTNTNYYDGSHSHTEFEIEKLKLIIRHKDELLQQKKEMIKQKVEL